MCLVEHYRTRAPQLPGIMAWGPSYQGDFNGMKITMAVCKADYSYSKNIFIVVSVRNVQNLVDIGIILIEGLFHIQSKSDKIIVSGVGHVDVFLSFNFPGHGFNEMLFNFSVFWRN